MKALKLLVLITALVVITGVISDAWAGCSPARLFRSQGKPNNTNNVKFNQVDVPASGSGTWNQGAAIGRLWDSDDANNSNSGLTDVNGDGTGFGSLCPPSVWWLPQGNPPDSDKALQPYPLRLARFRALLLHNGVRSAPDGRRYRCLGVAARAPLALSGRSSQSSRPYRQRS